MNTGVIFLDTLKYLRLGPLQKPPLWKAQRGILGHRRNLLNTYCVFERAPQPRCTFYGSLYKRLHSGNASEVLRYTKVALLEGGRCLDRRPRDAIRLPHTPDVVRTADALRLGRLRSTWLARPPGQPRTGSFQKIPHSPVLRAGTCRLRYAALKRPSLPGPLRYL